MEKTIFLGIGVVVLLILLFFELYRPARVYPKPIKGRSYATNIVLFIFNSTFLYLLQVASVSLIAYNFRLHTLFDGLPNWWQLIIGILLLDFLIWFWHMMNHKSRILWSFHKCHHSEKYLNVTSAIRFHLGELLLSVIFKAGILIVLGISLWVFILHESLITLFAMFHHANIRLPARMQKIVGLITITPEMHRVHHSTLRHEHDSNYGVMFSWWDKIFRTYQTKQPKHIGLQHIEEKGFIKTLIFPLFKK